jgi:hypothetical protein
MGERPVSNASEPGTGGGELIYCVLDLIFAKSEYTVMQRAVHIDPTADELLSTILRELKLLEAIPTSGTQASG